MVVECIPTTALRYLQEESGAGKLESLRSRSRLSLFQRADVHEEKEEDEGPLYAVCGEDGSEGCISGWKR